MTFNDQDIAAIQTLGYTLDEARFLYLVAVHSGYFVPRQFLTFSGTKPGKRSNNFVTKLESRGHATWREYHHTGGVYHLSSRTLYRYMGKENLSNRRRHSLESIRTRLLLLDFILGNLGFTYLETEPEKVAFFYDVLGVPRKALPGRTYEGGTRSEPTRCYFVDKFPLFLDHTESPSSPVVTFSYVDPGQASRARFANHLDAYLPLLRQLETFSFLYVANSPALFLAAEQCFVSRVRIPLQADISCELLRYFRLRNAWDLKRYGSLSASDIEWLKEATHRFRGERFEGCYHAWSSGARTEESLRTEFEQLRPHRSANFRTCLFAATRFGKKSLAEEGESALQPPSSPEALASRGKEEDQ